MSNSYSETLVLTCENCGKDFKVDVQLILDSSERPDLLEKLRDGTLHSFGCPHCHNEGLADLPLLIFNPDRDSPILFSPAQDTTTEEDERHARGLLGQLRASLGTNWDDDWLKDGLWVVHRQALRQSLLIALSDDPRAAMLEAKVEAWHHAGSAIEKLRMVGSDQDLKSREAEELLERWMQEATEQGNDLEALYLQADLQLVISAREGSLPDILQTKPKAGWDDLPEGVRQILNELGRPGRPADMSRRAEMSRDALGKVSREAFPEWWGALQTELANSLAKSPLGDRAENLEQAIEHFRLALEVHTREAFPDRWAGTQHNLGSVYSARIRGDRGENLELAIGHFENALEVSTHEGSPKDWAETVNNLGNAYADRICGDRADNLERAIELYQQALEVYNRENFPTEWASIQNNLGLAFENRIRGDRADNLESSIAHYQGALEVRNRKEFPEDWAQTMNNLGKAYAARIKGDRAENLEQAIECGASASEIYTRESFPEEWAGTHYNLGEAYRVRIAGNRLDNVEEAIGHFQQALEIYTRQAFPKDWALTQNGLASAYYARVRGDRADNLEQAIGHYKQALEIHTRQAFPEDWAANHDNLGSAYSDRIRGARADNVEEAIGHYEQALEVYTGQAYPERWALTQDNLATAYSDRLEGDRAENLEQAIKHYRQALEIYTREAFPERWATTLSNLGNAYVERLCGERLSNREQALGYYCSALEVLQDLHQRRRTGYTAGKLGAELGHWRESSNAFLAAVMADQSLFDASISSRESRGMLLQESQQLYPYAAYSLVHSGSLEKAVEVIESGRARQMRETLERTRRDLQRLPGLGFGSLLETYLNSLRERQALLDVDERNRPENWLLLLTASTNAYERAVRDIRVQVGSRHAEFRYFMQTLPFEVIKAQAEHSPLVYLFAAPAGGLALIVTADGVSTVELAGLTQEAVASQIYGKPGQQSYLRTYEAWRLEPYADERREAWKQALDDTLRWSWQAIMAPILHALEEAVDQNSRVVLIPLGLMGLLPLHAAWTLDVSRPCGREYAFDHFIFTYAPNANALRLARSRLAGIPTESLLMIENPNDDLHFSEQAAETALALFDDSEHLAGADASIEAVCSMFGKFNVLYFFTHGFADFFEPLESGLELADHRRLTIAQIFGLETEQARLAVLSACETGVQPELGKLDEVVSLPSSMMQAGVPAVIGSLWTVVESSTAILMSIFFEEWRLRGSPAQAALRKAQFTLRDAPYSREARDYFKQSLPESNLSPAGAADVLLKELKLNFEDFAHPFYWAAFTYTGL